MKEIEKAIKKWSEKHKGNVVFVASFFAFDKNHEVKDDSMWFSFGDDKEIKFVLDCLKDEIKQEKLSNKKTKN